MARKRDRRPDDEDDLVVSWLTGLDHDDLVAELLRLADGDAPIRALLQARACAATAEELIDDGAANEAIELVRETFGLVTNALAGAGTAGAGTVGSGTAGSGTADNSLTEAARELLDLHLRACLAAHPPPDPVELGTYLADLILDDTAGLTPSLEDYGALLGRPGVLAIRDRITAVFRADPDHPNARHLIRSLGGP
jgi:hypothetical protein